MAIAGLVVLGLAGGALALARKAAPDDSRTAVPACIEPAPCVYVEPDPAAVTGVGTEYVYRGRGWRAGAPVVATFSEFCPPDATCDNGARRERSLVADSRGRFAFRLSYDPSGGIPDGIRFTQRRGGRSVSRDAIPTPGRSTREQRREATRLAAVTRRAHRTLRGREGAVDRGLARAHRSLRRCDAMAEAQQNVRTAPVANAVYAVAFDQALVRALRRQLDAFAADLARERVSDPRLRAGADAWTDAIRRSPLDPSRTSCAALRRWRDAGYADAQRPVDPDTVGATTFEQIIGSSPALRAAEGRMRTLGAGRAAAERFGGGLIERRGPSGGFR